MSWSALKWAERVDLTKMPGDASTNRLMLILLARRASDCGHAWPNQQFFVDTVGKKERTIRQTVEYLVDAGLIAVYHRNRFGETHRSSMYLVLFPDRSPTDDECRGCEADRTRQSTAVSTRQYAAGEQRQYAAGEQPVTPSSSGEESVLKNETPRALVHTRVAP